MEGLPVGSELQTEIGQTVRILDVLGEGGRGAVYKVQYGNQQKALKWYLPNREPGIDSNALVMSLRKSIMAGPPAKGFIWPQDLIVWQNGGFGYIADLVPPQFCEAGGCIQEGLRSSRSFVGRPGGSRIRRGGARTQGAQFKARRPSRRLHRLYQWSAHAGSHIYERRAR